VLRRRAEEEKIDRSSPDIVSTEGKGKF